MENENNQEEQFKSEYHTGEAQVGRLNDLTVMAHDAFARDNLTGYDNILQRIDMEIRTYCTPDQLKERKDILHNNPKHKRIPEVEYKDCDNLQEWDDKKERRVKILRGRYKRKLIAYEDFLRRIMKQLNFLGIQKKPEGNY